jgi:hypothetical protein
MNGRQLLRGVIQKVPDVEALSRRVGHRGQGGYPQTAWIEDGRRQTGSYSR